MSQPIEALLADCPGECTSRTAAVGAGEAAIARRGLQLTICEDLDPLATEWRAFEHQADGTVFQSFDWLSLWHRHVGAPAGVRPAIVLGREHDGTLLFLLPLAVTPGLMRRLRFLGDDLCDYNAPLIAPAFFTRPEPADFRTLWREIRRRLQQMPQLRHDLVELTKMPETIGGAANPFLALETRLNPSGAYLTRLAGTWDEFYTAKRSSATRRRDRTKRKRLAEQGEVCFATPHDPAERARTLEMLMMQKSKAFARMGVANLFVRPGYREFFLALASNPRTQDLVHISRLEVGPTWAAINLGLTFRGTYYHILASYDDGEVARFGPGAAHLRDLLQFAIEKGCTHFDFTIGDESYKREWSDTTLKLYDHLAAASLRGWPVVMASRAFRRLKRFIKQTPIVWRCFSAARGAIALLRGRGRASGAQGDPPDTPSLAPE